MGSENKLPIPLQSVTMSAEQYEEICKKVNSANTAIDNVNRLFAKFRENGVMVDFGSVVFDRNEIKDVFVANDPLSGKLRIAIQ